MLQSKYYPSSTVLEAPLGSRPSFAWRSIRGAQVLMQLGMQKELGNGNDLRMLKDGWLPTKPPRPPKPREGFDPDRFSLPYFKENNSDEWNMFMLHAGFPREEVKLITQIKPGGVHSKADYSWIYNKNGDYTVKSGYWAWRTILNPEEDIKTVNNPNLNPLFEALWLSKAPPKIRHFIWKVLSNCVATGDNMEKKRLTKVGDCPRCSGREENINHILFLCPFARLVWALSPVSHLLLPETSTSVYENLCNLLLPAGEWKEEDKLRHRIWPWVVWQIWKSRNDMVFSAWDQPANDLMEEAQQESQSWFECNVETLAHPSSSGMSRLNKKWKPPDRGFLKCNTDGSWVKGNDLSGIGWILRNHTGQVIKIGAKCLPRLTSPMHVEAATIVWAVSCVKNLGYSNVIFESDCANVIDAILEPKTWPALISYTSDIVGMCSEVCGFSFKFSSRSSNICADIIAKTIASAVVYFATLIVLPPLWLQSFVDVDIRGLDPPAMA